MQSRRSPKEVRRLVLEAAHQLFNELGYHRVRTRDIADAAGVGESVVFRNYGSKAELFQASILGPFGDFIDSWAKSWERRPVASADPEQVTRSFVKGIYQFTRDHRQLLLTLLTASAAGDDDGLAEVAEGVSAKFAESIFVMRRVLLSQSEARSFERLDPPVTVAVAVGSIMSLVLMPDWLFPAFERAPSQARQIEELVQMLVHGVADRPA